MQDLRTIKQRMGAIRNIRKIADAMKMVSTVKYWRLQEALRRARAIVEELGAFVPPALAAASGANDDEKPAKEGLTLVLAFFPHRGMCGPLTQNLAEAVAGWYPPDPVLRFAVYGKKGAGALPEARFPRQKDGPVLSTEGVDDEALLTLARWIAHGVTTGRFTRVEAVAAGFRNLMRQTPMRVQLVPLPADGADKNANGDKNAGDQTSGDDGPEMELEPDAATLMGLFLPLYLECELRRLLHECLVSEHASRMTAMDNASKNAQELLEKFRLEYNKIRQSKITLELMEIISGSEALQ